MDRVPAQGAGRPARGLVQLLGDARGFTPMYVPRDRALGFNRNISDLHLNHKLKGVEGTARAVRFLNRATRDFVHSGRSAIHLQHQSPDGHLQLTGHAARGILTRDSIYEPISWRGPNASRAHPSAQGKACPVDAPVHLSLERRRHLGTGGTKNPIPTGSCGHRGRLHAGPSRKRGWNTHFTRRSSISEFRASDDCRSSVPARREVHARGTE